MGRSCGAPWISCSGCHRGNSSLATTKRIESLTQSVTKPKAPPTPKRSCGRWGKKLFSNPSIFASRYLDNPFMTDTAFDGKRAQDYDNRIEQMIPGYHLMQRLTEVFFS